MKHFLPVVCCSLLQGLSLLRVMVAGSWLGLSLCPAVLMALLAAALHSLRLSTPQHTPAPGRSTARYAAFNVAAAWIRCSVSLQLIAVCNDQYAAAVTVKMALGWQRCVDCS